MIVVSSIQPCFVPWLGYFEQIALADVFIYLDDVQYTKKDWRNRNQLKSPNGPKFIHIPIQKPSRDAKINEVLISYNEPWEPRLLNQIQQWYKKAPFLSDTVTMLEAAFQVRHERLVDLNYDLNLRIMDYVGIHTPILYSSQIPKVGSNKNERIVELCTFANSDVLYDGKSAQNFIDMDLFQGQGIQVVFQDYQHRPYPQLWGAFEPYMSILDLIMNQGKDSLGYILSSPVPDIMKQAPLVMA